jgi:hypothetical protein
MRPHVEQEARDVLEDLGLTVDDRTEDLRAPKRADVFAVEPRTRPSRWMG